jgi:hypothetical protein
MIRLKPKQWENLHQQLTADNSASVMMLRYKMKEVLGFTVRNHHEWIDQSVDRRKLGYYQDWFYLDFYDDRMETWFRMKYADHLFGN